MKLFKEQKVPTETKVIFSEHATEALIAQAVHIFKQTQDVDKADKFLDTMKSYIIDILLNFPKLGRPAEEFGESIRKLVYQRYSILYRIKENHIEILTLYRENLPNF
jgi:plasmid stabilization system protein ParE